MVQGGKRRRTWRRIKEGRRRKKQGGRGARGGRRKNAKANWGWDYSPVVLWMLVSMNGL